jgi:hypothetical protein
MMDLCLTITYPGVGITLGYCGVLGCISGSNRPAALEGRS